MGTRNYCLSTTRATVFRSPAEEPGASPALLYRVRTGPDDASRLRETIFVRHSYGLGGCLEKLPQLRTPQAIVDRAAEAVFRNGSDGDTGVTLSVQHMQHAEQVCRSFNCVAVEAEIGVLTGNW